MRNWHSKKAINSFLIYTGYFFISLIILFLKDSSAANSFYPASEIPVALKEGAHAVVRLNQTQLVMEDAGKAIMTERIVVTILDPRGNDYASVKRFYDRFTNIKRIEGALYNKQGAKIRNLANADIKDQSAVSSNNLFEDSRCRFARFDCSDFPYTVEFIIETKYNALIHSIYWMPVEEEYMSMEKGILTVVNKADLPFNYWSLNKLKPIVSNTGSGQSSVWAIDSVSSVKLEEFGPAKQFPCIGITPLHFRIENYETIVDSWNAMSRFFFDINQNRDILDKEAVDEIKSLAKNCKDKKEIVKTLYYYLQDNTRYISIQLGLGGWQCYDANYVYKYKLGDCKALSNYMKALLKVVGIDSYQALIHAGEETTAINPGYVSNEFNHVILYVPFEKDTIWLECTSKLAPAGYLSDFTQNRYCLPLSESGSGLIKIPLSKEFSNEKRVFAELFMDSIGKLNGKLDVTYTSSLSEDAASYFKNYTDKKFNEWLNKDMSVKNGSLTSAKLVNPGRDLPKTEITCFYLLDQTFAAMSNRAFLKACVFDKLDKVPYLTDNRKFDLVNSFPLFEYDSILYHLPANVSIENYPKEQKKITSEFGDYSLQLNWNEEQRLFTVIRKYRLNEFDALKERGAELKKYFSFVYKADGSEFVATKK